MSKSFLDSINKSDLVRFLTFYLEDISLLLDSNDGTPESREGIIESITKLTKVSDYLTELIKSGKHKFKKKEITKLRQTTTKISNDLATLIRSKKDVLEENEDIQNFLVSIRNSINRSKIIVELMDYEKR